MVNDGLSATTIRNYFLNWARWWARTVSSWTIVDLIEQFIRTCWESAPAVIAAVRKYKTVSSDYSAIHFAGAYPKLSIISDESKQALKEELTALKFNKTLLQAEETCCVMGG